MPARLPVTTDQQEILFGFDPSPGIVAVEAGDERSMEVWVRDGDVLERRLQPIEPFLWIADRDLLKGFKDDVDVQELAGGGPLRYLVTVADGRALERLRRHLARASRAAAASPDATFLYIGDRVHLHLLRTGQTLFKGLGFGDLRRLQLDIETHTGRGFEFSNPEREGDRILSIAVTDSSGYEEVIWGGDLDETAMIERLGEVIRERDPDLIEGHNLYKFDLDYLRVRATRCGAGLAWGRDGSEARFRRSRVQIAERSIDYPVCEVRGRHLIDTWLLAQFYDLSTGRLLESYGLKQVAAELGVALSGRELVDAREIPRLFAEQPDRLRRYNLDDCRELARLAEVLQASYFIQAQIFPYSYHHVIVRGQATKINALFLRESLRRRHSVPLPPGSVRSIVGGFTAVYETGVVESIVHCDVSSLYPSIMLVFEIEPEADELRLFLGLLRDLRAMRLEAKAAMRRASGAARKHHDALQSTLKIVINSFYGYLGSPFANWADSEAANRVTSKGRELIQMMIEWLRERGARPVEVDTDGIYFVPPAGVRGERREAGLIAELAAILEEGIEVELAGRYRAMLSYKMKNYALLDYEGRLHIAGSGLRSRGLERFQRDFLREAIRMVLEGRREAVRALYERTLARLAAHEFHVSDFMKTETLADSLAEYRRKVEAKKRNRSAVYELALRAERDYRPGDQLSYYIAGDSRRVRAFDAARPASSWTPERPDENVPYYQHKLTELFRKFAPVLGVDPGGQEELMLG